ncbi:MAG: peptidoglycan-binding protein [Candidatus Pacebacteria bacterium]|nr:peptidoglycan-binding protein [Candidatus Paceibacterota bacterium]MCF7862622.1 peptidoglycan-binding protein [Candidatus Paceibacterota bacterium]
MSKLLKSKFLLGTMLVVALLVVGAFASTANAQSACSLSSTLRVGSMGAEVSCLQTKLGINADGKFGPMTKAAVMSYQASKGLSADGVVGMMTRSSLAGSTVVVGNLPAGCTSTSPFSSTTGLSCAVAASSVAGCMPGYAFSPLNGASCTGGETPANTTLTGGAGDASIVETSTDVETNVNEGASDVKVHGFKVTADGSDIAVTNLKVSLVADGASSSSYRLNHYADSVSVWMGSKKVGSADVSEFAKDGNTYSKTIALSDAVVKEGTSNKATFYVTVDANDNIDSTDFNATWTMTASSIRFKDGTGVILTDDYSKTSSFQYQSLSSSGDVKVVVSKGTGSPATQNVEVSDTSSTDVLMLEFKIKATGADVTFDTLNITTALTTAGADTYSDIVGELQMKNGSNVLATLDGSDLDGTETFTLDDTFTVSEGDTETFKVYAKINSQSNFTSGAALTVSFASFSPEGPNGDVLSDTGSAIGSAQKFVNGVPLLAMVSASLPSIPSTHTDGTGSGAEDLYTATLKFTITAPEDAAIYVPKDSFSYATAGTAGVQYTVTGGATVISAIVQYSGSDSLSNITESNSYRIDAGVSQQFTLSVVLKGNDAYGKVTMTGLSYETTESTPNNNPTATISDFYTSSTLLAK